MTSPLGPQHVVGLRLLAAKPSDAATTTASSESADGAGGMMEADSAGMPVESFDVFCLAQHAGMRRLSSSVLSSLCPAFALATNVASSSDKQGRVFERR